MSLEFTHRFTYWLIGMALTIFVPLNLSWWLQNHHLLNRDGWIAGTVSALVGAIVLARRDVRGR